MNKQQLAAKIWESANQMRSKAIEANDYKDYILGFIFYKYLSDKLVQFALKEDFSEEDLKMLTEEDEETVKHFKNNIGYFITYKDLFSTWVDVESEFEVGNVRDALSAFSRLISKKHKKLFEGIFNTLQTGLSKLGENAASQTKAISQLIHLIKAIPMDGRQDYDVLGFIYEYLISQFAANAGKKAGEFYTPHEVSLLMSEVIAHHLKDRKEIQIYDSTSGSGSLLINIGKSVARYIDDKNNIKYFAQELKQNTYNLTRMNLVMRGILPNNIVTRNGDTLEDDWPYFNENDPTGTYDPLYVDAVVSNPPYSQNWESDNKDADPRYARFGLAPKTKADFAFLLHDLYHIKPDGIMAIVLPHGVLFRGGEEGVIRKKLIEGNYIDTVLGLPPNIFFGTGIPTTVLFLKQRRSNTDILIVDASRGFIKEGKNNKLQASDVKRITDAIIQRESREGFAKVVSRDDIRANDYNLNIPRYVDSSDAAESWDIYASMFGGIPANEIKNLDKYWQAFPSLRDSLFVIKASGYASLKVENLKNGITTHSDVKAFIEHFGEAFSGFDAYLKKELLDQVTTVNTSQEETILSEDLFARLVPFTLIDKYEAYQLLDNKWVDIAVDLEIIQTEGFAATKIVDPNMVIKKGKEQEVQEGWKGRIMPFDLVQETYHQEELLSIKNHENRILEITSEIEEILDSLSEEEKEEETVNETKDGFINSEVAKEAKELLAEMKKKKIKYEADSYQAKILKTNSLITEEKDLKKKVKLEEIALHLKTKVTIENLTYEQVYSLLELKWINPLVTSIHNLPGTLIQQLSLKIQTLADKYATTYADVANEINDAQNSLADLINVLTGNEQDMKGLEEFKSFLKTD